MQTRHSHVARLRNGLLDNWQLKTLLLLLSATFLMGGGSRGDIMSLIVLRPLAILCLGLGLYSLTAEQLRQYRVPLGIMGAIVVLILIHLIPLPPVIWTNLPGRDIAVEATALAGLEGIWRPISLVPYRGWNSFYAMLVPAAAMVLAVQVDPGKHRAMLYLVLGAACLSVVLGIVQAASGFGSGFYLYRVTNGGVPTGLFANRNHFAALLCTVLPALALVASRAGGASRSLMIGLCFGGALLVLFMILATGSRAGLGLSVVGLVFSWIVWSARPNRARHRKVGPRWIAPAIGLGLCLVVTLLLAVIFGRADALDRISSTNAAEEFRGDAWMTTLASIWQYMPFGSGIGSFVEVFKIEEPARLLGFAYWNHAHNDWLEWLLEGGVPAAILMLVAIWTWSQATLRLWGQRGSGRYSVQLGLAGAGAILILGLWSLVDYPLRVPSMASLAAIAAVWMVAPRVASASAPRRPEV